MDWLDTGYYYHVEVNLVSPVNVDDTLGSLSGVLLSGTSVTENYNSDTRIQGKVTTVVKENESDGYRDNARLRIIVTIPDQDWSRELMTGFVSNINESYDNGYCKREYTIEGSIWGLTDHYVNSSVIIAKKAGLVHVWGRLLSRLTRMQFNTTGAQDHAFTSNVVYEAGTSLSSILFEVASGYNRMDTDGHGKVVLRKYVSPSSATANRVIDLDDVRGLMLYPLSKSSSKWEVPGRAIVTTTKSVTSNGKTVQKTLVGSYDAPSTNSSSMAVKGYLKAIKSSYSGASSEPNQAELDAVAKRNWQNAQNEGNEWSCKTVYADYHAGDVVNLVHPAIDSDWNRRVAKCLITNVKTDLNDWTQDLTLKEV